MKSISIDIETFASANLGKCGVYRYAESEDFSVLLFGYAVDGGPVRVVDLASGETIPTDVLAALEDENVTKWAFNAQFERVCLSKFLGMPVGDYLDPESWRCSMVWSAYMGLPLSLEGAGAVLGLEKQKLSEGKDLVRYFCTPCGPTKTNGGRTRNLPEHDPEKWARFKAYNLRDVEAEMQIQRKLQRFPVPESVWEEYYIDQEINDRGIRVDMDFVRRALALDQRSRSRLLELMRNITNLENPNSVQQMKDWLADNGLEMDSLGKKEVAAVLKTAPEPLAEVLALRQQLAKSSVKKYTAMETAVCPDGRARGMFQFYGANRTGRESGKIIQLQNLPQNHIPDLAEARALVRAGDFDAISMLYEDIPDTLSQLIRTAFVPREGTKFIVSDFSAIEARVLSWLAGEQWRMEVFANGGDIYCATASRMFHCNVVKHGENGHLRQKGKQCELACIRRGSLVLTDTGLVPIQYVTARHKVWDGLEWVPCDGAVFRGRKDVLAYDGLCATADHLVYVQECDEPVPFSVAVEKHLKLRRTDRKGYSEDVYHIGLETVYDIVNAGPRHRFTVSGCLVHNCGYGGSVGAMKAMGAIEAGMQEDELQPLVDAWRQANPRIVQLWWDVDKAVKTCVKNKVPTETHGIRFSYQSGMMFAQLPSGRKLAYVKPCIGENRFGGESVTYMGIGATKKWERLETFGGKCVENLIQAISRDILFYAMRTLRCCSIVAHVHDEIIIEADPRMSVDAVCEQMGRTPPWAEGLVLRADGYETTFYKKD